MKVIDTFLLMAKQPDAAEQIQKFMITGLMALFIIIFAVYAILKLLGF